MFVWQKIQFLVAGCLALAITAGWTEAAPVQTGGQAPGFFRLRVGAMEVTALYDGYVAIGDGLLKNLDPQTVRKLLAERFLDDANGVQTAVNAYLVRMDHHLVLVDAGSAACFGPTAGHLADALKAAGTAPQDVDTIVITHMHPDHVCGLTDANGQAVYTRATVWASQAEADFWLSDAVAKTQPEGWRGMFRMAQRALAPYRAAHTFHTVADGQEILPGLRAIASPGHTPGHTSYLFTSQGGGVLLWGDIMHSYAVQFPHPEVAYAFDSDQQLAVRSRQQQLELAAHAAYLVGGAHLPFPGLGHVRQTADQAYAWVPAEYAPLPDTSAPAKP